MSKKILVPVLIVVAAIVIAGGIYAAQENNMDDITKDAPYSSADRSNQNMNDTRNDTKPAAEDTKLNGIVIRDFSFTPAEMEVKVGTTVTWTNQDSDRHDVAPDVESANFPASELLAKGETYSHTFTKAGIYAYHCSPHPYMKATIKVIE